MAMPFYPEMPFQMPRYPVVGRLSGQMPLQRLVPSTVNTCPPCSPVPVAPMAVPFPAPLPIGPPLAAPMPFQIPITSPFPVQSYSPVRVQPQLQPFSPSSPNFGGQSAADALDAADGVIDGKFFGMRILAPTQGDPYASPTKGYGGAAGGAFGVAPGSSGIFGGSPGASGIYTGAPGSSGTFGGSPGSSGIYTGAPGPSGTYSGAPGAIASGVPLGPGPSSPYFPSSMSPTYVGGPTYTGGFASPSSFSSGTAFQMPGYPGSSPVFTSSGSVMNSSYNGTLTLGGPYSPLPSSINGMSATLDGPYGLPSAGFLTGPPSSLPITSGALTSGGVYGQSFTGAFGESVTHSSYLNGTPGDSFLSTGQMFGTPYSGAAINTALPPPNLSSTPGPISGLSTSLLGTPLGGSMAFLGNTSSPSFGGPGGEIPPSPMGKVTPREGGGGPSTINISNTGWEKAVDELKKELDSLKVDGGMSALRDLLQMKVDELEKCRQSELVKEKELHRLQDMYAEEIRKHTEDLAKVRKAETDLTVMKQAEDERKRLVQVEQEKAAAEALAQIEAMRAAQANKPKKAKKGKKKAAKKSPQKPLRR